MIEGHEIIKEFGEPPQRVLHGLTFQIKTGEFVSISGRSGSGKSTLLYIISTLDAPSRGRVSIDGQDVQKMSVDEVHSFRNRQVGFIFQFHYLLPELTAVENVLLPAKNLGREVEMNGEALEWLGRLGIRQHADKLPSQMSGGEQQRVAIARALLLRPKYIFADEPTGNLDTHNANLVMSLLKETHKNHGTTIALVTHDPSFSKTADREILLVDGKITN